MSSIDQFMSMQLGEQLATVATLNCLEFTFSEGGQNWQGGTNFGGGLIFSLHTNGAILTKFNGEY